MIDIPLGKALVPMEAERCNEDCMFHSGKYAYPRSCPDIACKPVNRRDSKGVIFKLVDYSPSLVRGYEVLDRYLNKNRTSPALSEEEVDELLRDIEEKKQNE